ncbi:MAG: corrinoid protein [Candidatus Hydrogenedentes bacterium]|nr:corrinoid protein [Candidatus Hydrogenedentota bacterium]
MADLLEQIAICIERGKVNKNSPYPPDLKGQDGADELVKQALDQGIAPDDVLGKGLTVGMGRVGQKFSENKVFVPDLLMAAKAMSAGMAHLKPAFESGQAHHKGTFVIGTVQGDLHDIGKNLVAMVVEGGGWKVVDLGVDVSAEKFLAAVKKNPGAAVGLSALLTTTMVNMEKTVRLLKEQAPGTRVIVGGAPLTAEFAKKVGADGYSPDPQGAIKFLAA